MPVLPHAASGVLICKELRGVLWVAKRVPEEEEDGLEFRRNKVSVLAKCIKPCVLAGVLLVTGHQCVEQYVAPSKLPDDMPFPAEESVDISMITIFPKEPRRVIFDEKT